MADANFAPTETNRIDTQIGLVFEDQRTAERRQVIYVDDRVVLVRDEAGNTTLSRRDAFDAELGTRYRPRPNADVAVDVGQYGRLRDLLAEYDRRDGRKADHKADALREALDLLAGNAPDAAGSTGANATDDSAPDSGASADEDETDESATEEVPFEEIPGIGPETAGKLRTAGYVFEGDLRAADDDDLLAVAGVGPGNLENIREFLD